MAEDRRWEHDWVFGPPPVYHCAHGKVVNGQVVVDVKVHEHRFCKCPPGYCSRTCLDCRAHADAEELTAMEVAAW